MIFEILTVLALSAVVSGLVTMFAAWSTNRRLLAVEEYLKVREPAVDDRLNQIQKVAIREMKSDAAKTRWSKREVEEAALVKQLANPAATEPDLALWDPRTWGR